MRHKSIDVFKRMALWQKLVMGVGVVGLAAVLLVILVPPVLPAHAAGGDWSTYQYNNDRTGFNPNETQITVNTAPNLKEHWVHTSGGPASAQPAVANSQVYWGSWDGYEHSTSLSNARLWTNKLNTTNDSSCNPPNVGVASSATIATVTIGGKATSVDFVGGGDSNLYAINALTGATIWHTQLGTQPNYFIWDSPALYNGSIFIGISSFGDCPLVQSKLFKINASTGQILSTFNAVPNGCTGAGIWGSPTVDQSDGSVYVVTGNSGSCSSSEPYAFSLIKLHSGNLTVIRSWHVPTSQIHGDTDFGGTPTLFTATINGVSQKLIGVVNKNGIYYAWNRSNISSGPVWTFQVGNGGDCPQCGSGNVSPSMFDGTNLYVAGGNTSINGSSCQGSINALNPATGKPIWQKCLNDGPVLAAVTGAPGLAIVEEGSYLKVVAASTGNTLYTFHDPNNQPFYGSAAISNGVIYVCNLDNDLYAIGL